MIRRSDRRAWLTSFARPPSSRAFPLRAAIGYGSIRSGEERTVSDAVTLARIARESLARGLNALQADPNIPQRLLELAAPIAQAMGALHQIERSGGAQLGPNAQMALAHVQTALAELQAQPTAYPAVNTALEAVAGALGTVHSLARAVAAQPVVQAPPAAAPVAAPPRGEPLSPRRRLRRSRRRPRAPPRRSRRALLPLLPRPSNRVTSRRRRQPSWAPTARATSTKAFPATTSSNTAACSCRRISCRRSVNPCVSGSRFPAATSSKPTLWFDGGASRVIRGTTRLPASARSSQRSRPKRDSSCTATCGTANRCFTTISELPATLGWLASPLRPSPGLPRGLGRIRAARARASDPKLLWKTLETAHFRINYYSTEDEVAEHIATLAEAIHARLVPPWGGLRARRPKSS